jgi:hypothetical protein
MKKRNPSATPGKGTERRLIDVASASKAAVPTALTFVAWHTPGTARWANVRLNQTLRNNL